jgi:two-component system phosphate regulon sensor histidine kinase PhoR
VRSIIQKICDDEASLISKGNNTLSVDIDKGLKITGSESEIISVCNNLIQNAMGHTPDGTQIEVVWKKSATTGDACFIVSDNGQGVPAEDVAHLTERFYRVDKGRSRDSGGTGLGLAIVQHIMQRHGGRLDIVSTVGRGSRFTACYPSNRICR